MKKTNIGKTHIFTFAIMVFSIVFCRGQAIPSNDDFTNRTFLIGNDISFEGTLVGATWESDPFEVVSPLIPEGFNTMKTVWWEWTAPVQTGVILEIENLSKSSYGSNAVSIYDLNDFTSGSSGKRIQDYLIDTRWPRMFFTFQAMSGTNYQIQLAGQENIRCSFKLIATNLPYIIEQPQHQSITAGDSVMFGVVATGSKPFSYQWQRNGTNLPGETAPILALDHVATNEAGPYRVIITNSRGTTLSDTANLSVTATDPAAEMSIAQSESAGQFGFALLGDMGRRYRIQSSSNLLNWVAEASFPSITFYDAYQSVPPSRSMVINLTGADSFVVPRMSTQRFYRAVPFHATNENCNNNLKQIRFAQLLWGYEWNPEWYSSVSHVDLLPYLKSGGLPVCPANGDYYMTTIWNNPSCSIPNHIFEER